jgi:hypothetical protein
MIGKQQFGLSRITDGELRCGMSDRAAAADAATARSIVWSTIHCLSLDAG